MPPYERARGVTPAEQRGHTRSRSTIVVLSLTWRRVHYNDIQRFLEIGGVKALSEPVIDLRQQLVVSSFHFPWPCHSRLKFIAVRNFNDFTCWRRATSRAWRKYVSTCASRARLTVGGQALAHPPPALPWPIPARPARSPVGPSPRPPNRAVPAQLRWLWSPALGSRVLLGGTDGARQHRSEVMPG